MQGSQTTKSFVVMNVKSMILQFVILSFLLIQPFNVSYVFAAPVGGNVVGGSGSINQSNLTTTINQNSHNLAVDWQSFDVNTNEQVNFVQPNTSSIALNRILGNNGTTIQGQINANGQVILVNPNGVLFTSTATINAGGLVASSLDMTPTDFMNGNYIFNEVIGADGSVINSGIINASVGGDSSTGGNVALIGKQVKNDGLISATLGSVILAAGKQSILTFDNQGLIGITVTKEVLQEELGLEEAIVNNGEIKAEGGRVLLTASVSQDVFSSAVNTNNIDQATSVVVNADGSFTLGGGSDVLNTGTIDVSSESNSNNTAKIVVLGENVTSSGTIKADTQNGNAGEIEIHSKNKTLLIQNSITSAQALATGRGGIVKILGDKVGLFDDSLINVSGFYGGGQALIGGDFQGRNSSIFNASKTLIGINTVIKADAFENGEGGKVIVWANDITRFGGNISATGGLSSGNGGFTEVSGKNSLDFQGFVNLTALNGVTGTLLLDPKNITISNSANSSGTDFSKFNDFDDNTWNITLNNETLSRQLQGSDVTLEAQNDINITHDINEAAANNSIGSLDKNLKLRAGRSIKIAAGVNITLDNKDFEAIVNHDSGQVLNANRDFDELAVFTMGTGSSINTNGGNIKIESRKRDDSRGVLGLSDDLGNYTLETLDASGSAGRSGGDILILNDEGSITLNSTVSSNGGVSSTIGRSAGKIEMFAGQNVTINGDITSNGGAASGTNNSGGNAGLVSIFSGLAATTQINLNADINANGGTATGSQLDGDGSTININTPKLVASGDRTISATGENPTGNTIGDINIYYDGVGNTYSSSEAIVKDLLLGGSLTITTGRYADINLRQNIDYDGLVGIGNLVLNAGNHIRVDEILDITPSAVNQLNITLNANIDNSLVGNVYLNDSINTGDGDFTVTGVRYLGRSYSASNVEVDTGTGSATITTTGESLLGRMLVGGDLEVTAGTNTSSSYGVISQGQVNSSFDILDVTGTATFNVLGTTVNDYIDLTNNNLLRGQINLATNAGATANVVDSHIDLRNTHTSTTLNNVTAYGNLTVNATGDLTAAASGTIRAISEDSTATGVTRTMNLNFGLNDIAGTTDSTFNSTGATFRGNDAGSNDFVNLNITGSAGHNVFNINNSASTPVVTTFIDLRNITVAGNAGNDVFNFNNSATGNSVDFTRINNWTVNGNSGRDTINTENINFNTVSDILFDGGSNIDTFNLLADMTVGVVNIAGGSGGDIFNLSSNIDGTVNGNTGADTFNILTTAKSIANIDGGTDVDIDTLVAANEDNFWLIDSSDGGYIYSTVQTVFATIPAGYRVKFNNIENISGGINDDIFKLINTGDITGLIKGGLQTKTSFSGNAGDVLDYSSYVGTVSVTLGTGFSEIEKVIGNNTASTFIGPDFSTAWDMTAVNSGTLSYTEGVISKSVDFQNFNNITGGDQVDTFGLDFDVTGSVNGGSVFVNGISNQNDIFNISTWVSGTLNGQIGDDLFNVSVATPTVPPFNPLLINGGVGDDKLEISTTSEANFWAINSANGQDGAVYRDTVERAAGSAINRRITYTGIEDLKGSTSNDDFQFALGSSIAVGGSIDGNEAIGDNDVVDYSKLAVVTVSLGGTQNISNIEQITGNHDGTSGDSTILLSNIANTVSVKDFDGLGTIADGVNDGVVNQGVLNEELTFIDFNNISGGTLKDDFTIKSDGSITGLLDGAGGSTDTLTIENASPVTVELGNTKNSNINVNNIETITASSSFSNSIISDGTILQNIWRLTGANSGTLNKTSTTDIGNNKVIFNNFGLLIGGIGNDDFRLYDSIAFSGSINGGTTGTDTLTGGNQSNSWKILSTGHTVTGLTGTFSDIEQLIGNGNVDVLELNNTIDFVGTFDGKGGSDQIVGGNRITDWVIKQNDSSTEVGGTVTGLTGNLAGFTTLNVASFKNVEKLTGNSNVDNFILHDSANFTGDIEGGIGTDTLTAGNRTNVWGVSSSTSGTVTGIASLNTFSAIETLVGGTGKDTLNLDDTINFSATFDGGGGFTDEIVGGNRTTNWQIKQNNIATQVGGFVTGLSGTLAGFTALNVASFKNVEILTGNAGIDNFILHSTADHTGSINGGGGVNSLTGGNRANSWQILSGANSVDGITNGFTNIENLIGNANTDRLLLNENVNFAGTFDGKGNVDEIVGGNQINQWQIYQNNIQTEVGGTVTGLTGTLSGFTTGSFKNVEKLSGNANIDTYSLLLGVDFSGSIDGNGGVNTLIAANNNINTWNITGINLGKVTGINNSGANEFYDIQNLTGGSFTDNYIFDDGAFVDGLIDGKTGADTVDLTKYTSGITVRLATTPLLNTALDDSAFKLDHIEIINTIDVVPLIGTDVVNTLYGYDRNNTWTIDGINSGNVAETVISPAVPNPETTTAFTNFEKIYGRTGDDNFKINDGGKITVTLDGGTGTNSLDYSSVNGLVEVNLSTIDADLNKVINVTGIKGNKNNSFVYGRDVDTTWTFFDDNRFKVENKIFTDFNVIQAGSQIDTFDFTDNAPEATSAALSQSINLKIYGNAGADVFNLSLSNAENGTVTFYGLDGNRSNVNTEADTFNTLAGTNLYKTRFTPNVGTNTEPYTDRLSYTSGTNTFNVNFSQLSDINDNAISNELIITGTNIADITNIQNAMYFVNAQNNSYRSSVIDFSNKSDIKVLGLVNDIVDIPLDLVNTGNVITFDIGVVKDNNNLITANELALINTGNVGSSGQRLRTNVTSFSVNNTGNIYLIDNDGINITGLNTSSTIDVKANGSVASNTGDILNLSGELIIKTSIGDIDLSASTNSFSGGLTLHATEVDNGDVYISNNTTTSIKEIITNNLKISSVGNITQTGAITAHNAASTATTELSSDGDIRLAAANNPSILNNFDNLTITNANNVRITDSDNLVVQTINATGTVDIVTTDMLTASNINANTVTTSSTGLNVGLITANIVNLNSGAGRINGTGTNIRNAASVELNATDGITVGLDTVGSIKATNNGTGDINIDKTGNLVLENITNNNTSGGFTLVSNGGDLTVKKVNLDYDNIAAEAHFEFNAIGNIYGDDATTPNLTANRTIFNMNASGTVGRSNAEPITLKVRDYIEVTGALGTYIRFYNGIFNGKFVGENEYKNIALQIIDNLAGQQLIQVESLAELDPAIFTDVRNYSNSEIALMMPADQRYTDNEEEDEEAKAKRQKFLNSTP